MIFVIVIINLLIFKNIDKCSKDPQTLVNSYGQDLKFNNAVQFVQNIAQCIVPAGMVTEYIQCIHYNYYLTHLCLCRVFPFH